MTKASTDASLAAINVLQSTVVPAVTLSSDFAKVKINAGTDSTLSTFFADSVDNSFVVDYSDSLGVAVGGASNITLSTGTIKVSTADQTIRAGNYNINGLSFASSRTNNDLILVTYNSNVASVGNLDVGEMFGVGEDTYKVTEVGLIRTSSSPPKLCGSGYDSTSGVFKVGSSFDTDIIALTTDGVVEAVPPLSTTVFLLPQGLRIYRWNQGNSVCLE